jgi:hypothetical protein
MATCSPIGNFLEKSESQEAKRNLATVQTSSQRRAALRGLFLRGKSGLRAKAVKLFGGAADLISFLASCHVTCPCIQVGYPFSVGFERRLQGFHKFGRLF